MPDGLLSNQKSQLGPILEGLILDNVGILYGTFSVHLVRFSGFWYHVPIKIWQP
jgi:hypothetical protein